MRGYSRSVRSRDQSLFCRKFKCQRHSQCYRLAVQQPVREPAAGFERVPESVTKIEQRTLAGFALVARNDAGFATAAYRNGMLARRTTGKDVLPILLKP